MSDYDPNSELTPPGPPLPKDETPDETRFDAESPAPRPDESAQETLAQTAEPTGDAPQSSWHVPESVQSSPEVPAELTERPVETVFSPSEPAMLVEAPSEDGRARAAAAREREFAGRIRDLTAQIEHYPNTPVNFVIRGEVYLAYGQPEAAVVDFQRALDLAESRVDQLPWGYVNAALIDRAREGLDEAQDRLQAARA